jgi:hypothetical protein
MRFSDIGNGPRAISKLFEMNRSQGLGKHKRTCEIVWGTNAAGVTPVQAKLKINKFDTPLPLARQEDFRSSSEGELPHYIQAV